MNRTVCVTRCRLGDSKVPELTIFIYTTHLLHVCALCLHASKGANMFYIFIYYIKTICSTCAICAESFDLWPFFIFYFVASVCVFSQILNMLQRSMFSVRRARACWRSTYLFSLYTRWHWEENILWRCFFSSSLPNVHKVEIIPMRY